MAWSEESPWRRSRYGRGEETEICCPRAPRRVEISGKALPRISGFNGNVSVTHGLNPTTSLAGLLSGANQTASHTVQSSYGTFFWTRPKRVLGGQIPCEWACREGLPRGERPAKRSLRSGAGDMRQPSAMAVSAGLPWRSYVGAIPRGA